jgi:hypothetical protein
MYKIAHNRDIHISQNRAKRRQGQVKQGRDSRKQRGFLAEKQAAATWLRVFQARTNWCKNPLFMCTRLAMMQFPDG